MRSPLALKSLSVGLVLLAASAVPARAADGTRRILAEMAPLFEPCVQPTAGPRVFAGCIDLHSSIHAHWAAYRLARYHPEFEPLAEASWTALEYEKVRGEAGNINYRYAKAWFLRLALEYELWCTETGRPDAQRLRPLAQDIAGSMLSFFESNPIAPLTHEYQNAPWAVVQLWSWYAHTGNASVRERIEALVENQLIRPMGTSFGADLNAAEFFSVAGNWTYLVARTQDAATLEQFLALQGPIPREHLEANQITALHGAGMGWSRIWALSALAQRVADPDEARRLRRSVRLHVIEGVRQHMLRAGNFFAYDHWVPQFAVYALTEGQVSGH